MTFGGLHQIFITDLQALYPANEARNITRWVFECLADVTPSQLLVRKEDALTEAIKEKLLKALEELKTSRPVQYVLNEAWFYGLKFSVNESVLIPRPETEELVEWIICDVQKASSTQLQILDIGTGSGCIPVSLKKNLPQTFVSAIDISDAALKIARENAAENKVDITYLQIDLLNEQQRDALGSYDIVVSNPPYIPLSNKESMQPNVLQYEPHLALFVENNDPLLFYRHISIFGKKHLKAGGSLYFEIHEDMGAAVVQLLEDFDYSVELRKDAQRKDRMIKAMLNYC